MLFDKQRSFAVVKISMSRNRSNITRLQLSQIDETSRQYQSMDEKSNNEDESLKSQRTVHLQKDEQQKKMANLGRSGLITEHHDQSEQNPFIIEKIRGEKVNKLIPIQEQNQQSDPEDNPQQHYRKIVQEQIQIQQQNIKKIEKEMKQEDQQYQQMKRQLEQKKKKIKKSRQYRIFLKKYSQIKIQQKQQVLKSLPKIKKQIDTDLKKYQENQISQEWIKDSQGNYLAKLDFSKQALHDKEVNRIVELFFGGAANDRKRKQIIKCQTVCISKLTNNPTKGAELAGVGSKNTFMKYAHKFLWIADIRIPNYIQRLIEKRKNDLKAIKSQQK